MPHERACRVIGLYVPLQSRGGAREPMRVSWGDRPSADAWYLLVGPNAFTGMTFVHACKNVVTGNRGKCPRVIVRAPASEFAE